MEKYQFDDIVWIITKRGVVIPILEKNNVIMNILTNSKYNKNKDKNFIYNCIIKDVFSEDELKNCLNNYQVMALRSKTLNILIEKECQDIKDWLPIDDEKHILRLAYKSLLLTDKQIRIIKNELQKQFVKKTNVNKNRTK